MSDVTVKEIANHPRARAWHWDGADVRRVVDVMLTAKPGDAVRIDDVHAIVGAARAAISQFDGLTIEVPGPDGWRTSDEARRALFDALTKDRPIRK